MINKKSTEDELKKSVIDKIHMLPTIPAILQKVIEISEDPDSSAEELQHAIEKDITIAAAILRLANSAMYGFTREVSDIKKAIIIIGFATSISIAISLSVLKALPARGDSSTFDPEGLWKHSIAAGMAAKLVDSETKLAHPAQAYIVGLLHDIGKIIENFVDADLFQRALTDSKAGANKLSGIELSHFGFDHQEAGAWLCERWKLPPQIENAIRYHHNFDECPEKFIKIAMVGHCANYIAHKAEIGNSGNYGTVTLDKKIYEILNITPEQIEQNIEEIKSKAEEINHFFEASR